MKSSFYTPVYLGAGVLVLPSSMSVWIECCRVDIPTYMHTDRPRRHILMCSLLQLYVYCIIYIPSVYVCVYACMCVCMFVCMQVCLSVCMSVRMSVRMYVRNVCACMHVCMHTHMPLYKCLCMYGCLKTKENHTQADFFWFHMQVCMCVLHMHVLLVYTRSSRLLLTLCAQQVDHRSPTQQTGSFTRAWRWNIARHHPGAFRVRGFHSRCTGSVWVSWFGNKQESEMCPCHVRIY